MNKNLMAMLSLVGVIDDASGSLCWAVKLPANYSEETGHVTYIFPFPFPFDQSTTLLHISVSAYRLTRSTLPG
jgi:hypothetical protein